MKIVTIDLKYRGEVPSVERDEVLYQFDKGGNWRSLRRTANKKKEEYTYNEYVPWGSDLEKELYKFVHEQKLTEFDLSDISKYKFTPQGVIEKLEYVLGWVPTKKKRNAINSLLEAIFDAQEYEQTHGGWGNQVYLRAVHTELKKLQEAAANEDEWK